MTRSGSPAASSISPVADRDRMDDVTGLDDVAAGHLDDDRLHGGRSLVRTGVGHRSSHYADAMPELPEVEAWVRELDPLVSRAPIEIARPGHIATLKTFDPPPSALEGRSFAGARRRGKNLLFPTGDGELVLRVHLMSAGRLRYLPVGKKGPTRPMFQVRFTDGGELLLTEAGSKKRAGVWLLTPAALDEELAHLGPDALALDAPRARRDPAPRAPPAPSAAPRPARARRDRARARERDPLGGASVAVPDLDRARGRRGRPTLATAIHDDLASGLELRLAGKGDADVYRVHGHFGEPCPRCGETLRRVDFEEHTITYCPACQTGGRILKDRRLSRLLR